MNKNLLLAVAISITIITAWDLFVLRPMAPKGPRKETLRGQAPVTATASPATVNPPFSERRDPSSSEARPVAEETRLLKTEWNEIVLSSIGGSVKGWRLRIDGEWIEMVLNNGTDARALSTFEEVSFGLRPSGNGAVLEAVRPGGLRARKRLSLGERYLHTLELEFENAGTQALDLAVPFGWAPGLGTDERAKSDNLNDLRLLAYNGVKAMKLKDGLRVGVFGWFGLDNRYFLCAFAPEERGQVSLDARTPRKQAPILKESIPLRLRPGESFKRTYRFYLGPKAAAELRAAGLGLEGSENLGLIHALGRALFIGLQWFHKITGNYGWSIILLTMCLQALLSPLTLHSFKHSVRMKELQPQVKKLQEQFKEDPKRMNVEMLNLYKRHGLKFMGMEGCLPILLQLPFFWAFYNVLRNAFELRGAPWMGWVKDLSVHDPYYVLPILMGAGMVAQQKMSGTPGTDPAQAKMMMLMPIFFTFLFLKLPAGLVLYWFTNSLVTIAVQQAMAWRHKQQKATR